MSASSDQQLPNSDNASHSASGLLDASWESLKGSIAELDRDEFASWLDDQLHSLENVLEDYVTDASRLKGRR